MKPTHQLGQRPPEIGQPAGVHSTFSGTGWRPELQRSRFGAQPASAWQPQRKKGPNHSFSHVRIREKVLALTSAADLLELSASMRQEFEMFHAVAAFRRIASSRDALELCDDPRLADHVARVFEFVRNDAVEKDTRGLSDIGWSCGRLLISRAVTAGLSICWMNLHLLQLDPQGCVNAVWTFSKPNLSGH